MTNDCFNHLIDPLVIDAPWDSLVGRESHLTRSLGDKTKAYQLITPKFQGAQL